MASETSAYVRPGNASFATVWEAACELGQPNLCDQGIEQRAAANIITIPGYRPTKWHYHREPIEALKAAIVEAKEMRHGR